MAHEIQVFAHLFLAIANVVLEASWEEIRARHTSQYQKYTFTKDGDDIRQKSEVGSRKKVVRNAHSQKQTQSQMFEVG